MNTGILLADFNASVLIEHPWLKIALVQWPISIAPALFTWLLPRLLGYSRGGMAWVGLIIAAIISAFLPLQLIWPPFGEWYWFLHYCLYGVFFLYALAGVALCSVGIRDGKRSAIWGLLAVLTMTLAAVADTVIWLDLANGPPFVPWGFIGFGVLLTIGYLRKPGDLPPPSDRIASSEQLANNLTRRSHSIPRKLLREGNIHLLPLYYLMYMSDLGREGIERSGSYRFADHIYRNVPSGQNAIGRWIDSLMLKSPATRAFRERYVRARDSIRSTVESCGNDVAKIRILALPCGLPRDLNEVAEGLAKDNPALLARLEYVGCDIDPELLKHAAEFTKNCPVPREFQQGNALLKETFPRGKFHCAVSTGLNEFLKPEQLRTFHRNLFDALEPGGIFFTSFTQQEQSSEFLMRAFELHTEYHGLDELKESFAQLPWAEVTFSKHETNLQLFVVARK